MESVPRSPEQFAARLAEMGALMESLVQEHRLLLAYAMQDVAVSQPQTVSGHSDRAMLDSVLIPTKFLGDEDTEEVSDALTEDGGGSPDEAFVINVNGLVDAMEVLNILHEFVKSTAIAAMTLVSAGSFRQMFNSALFLLGVGVIYKRHEEHHDRLDISDLQAAVALYPRQGTLYNPASLLKAVTLDRTRVPTTVVVATSAMAIGAMWGLLVWARLHPDAWLETDPDLTRGGLALLVGYFCKEAQDLDTLSMQGLILSFMFLFDAIFMLLHEFHTTGSFGCAPEGGVWDLHRHGVPWKYKFTGLPAMWFSTVEVKQRLVRHVQHAQHNFGANHLAVEELALFSLYGDAEQREQLAVALYDHEYRYAQDGDPAQSSTPRKTSRPHRLGMLVTFFFENLMDEATGERGKFYTVAPDDASPDGELEDSEVVKIRRMFMTDFTRQARERRALADDLRRSRASCAPTLLCASHSRADLAKASELLRPGDRGAPVHSEAVPAEDIPSEDAASLPRCDETAERATYR